MIIFYSYLILFLLYFFLFFSFKLLVKKFNLYDSPSDRKIHTIPIPYIGGAIIFSLINILIFFRDYPFELNYLIYTSSIVFIIGLLDDKFNLNPLVRLFTQFCSSVIILGAGILITNLGNFYFIGNLELYYFSYIITIFCIIISINSFNFIDGIDGLCSGVFISGIFLIILFNSYFNTYSYINFVFLYDISFIVSCFFITNYFFKKQKIFLGDSGSNLLGFFLSVILIYYTQSMEPAFHPVLAIWVLSIPVFDFFSILIARVFFLKINPMQSDKKHIHHLLLLRKVPSKLITLILVSANLIFGIFGLLVYLFLGSLLCLLSFFVLFTIYFYLTRFNISKIIN